MTGREFLRRHIEAVWGIAVPPLGQPVVALAAAGPLPPWTLYQASLARGLVTIWRPSVSSEERGVLLRRAYEATDAFDATNGMRREVVLWHNNVPHVERDRAQPLARVLTPGDAGLLDAFAPDGAAHYLGPEVAPCVGVIAQGRLVSVAHSARRTAAACELGIDTLLDARRQGYARTATLAWAGAVRREGLTPIYSAFADNVASLRLAASAGFTPVARGVYGPVAGDEE